MLQLGGAVSDAETVMAAEVRAALGRAGFNSVTAQDVRSTGDFLAKIIDLIRGCGFAFAIFSDRTTAPTLGNIFFEVGLATILGKPVQLIWHGHKARARPAPSDFIRNEWIAYRPGQEPELREAIDGSLARITDLAAYYQTIGQVAFDAPEADLELAFERFRQAILIANDPLSANAIRQIIIRLEQAIQREGRDDMASHRARLHRAAAEFLALLPQENA